MAFSRVFIITGRICFTKNALLGPYSLPLIAFRLHLGVFVAQLGRGKGQNITQHILEMGPQDML